MASAVYLFEAKGLQEYILDGGRLRDMVGASELVDSLCRSGPDGVSRDLLSVALEACGISVSGGEVAHGDGVSFSRRAGASFEMHCNKDGLLKDFQQFWQLVVAQYAPGLAYEDVIARGDTPAKVLEIARTDRSKSALRRGGLASALPLAGPFVRRSQRTGMPAIEHEHEEDVDRPTLRKRAFRDANELVKRFAPPDGTNRIWPTRFAGDEDKIGQGRLEADEPVFQFKGDRRIVGVVHIDGNGLGEWLSGLTNAVRDLTPPKQIEMMRAFSDAIKRATEGAAQTATRETLDPEKDKDDVMPARPIVLGGDDVTAIIRGDRAVPFAEAFLKSFERLSAENLAEFKLPSDWKIAQAMTACAGIAFVTSTLPFYLAHELAAALCKAAKREAWKESQKNANNDRMPSSLAFHRVTTSFIDDWDEIVREELKLHASAKDPPDLTLQPYGVGDLTLGLPKYSALAELGNAARNLEGRGALREFWSLLKSDEAEAERRYARWREIRKSKQPAALDAFDQAFEKLIGPLPDSDWPFSEDNRTPLGDLLMLLEAS